MGITTDTIEADRLTGFMGFGQMFELLVPGPTRRGVTPLSRFAPMNPAPPHTSRIAGRRQGDRPRPLLGFTTSL
jgi:hypothetical protein